MKKLLTALLVSCTFCIAQAQTLTIPQADINAIAAQAGTSVENIESWLEENNGNTLYQTYVAEYTTVDPTQAWQVVPSMPAWLPGEPEYYGYNATFPYYIQRVEGGNTYDCAQYSANSSNYKEGALCGLGYWDQYQEARLAGNTTAETTASTAMVAIFNALDSVTTTDPDTSALLTSLFQRATVYAINNTAYQQASLSHAHTGVPTTAGGYYDPTDVFQIFAAWDVYYYDVIENSYVDNPITGYTPCGPGSVGNPSWNAQRVEFDCGVLTLSNNQSNYNLGYWTTYPTMSGGAPYANALQMNFNVAASAALYVLAPANPTLTSVSFLNTLSTTWSTEQANDALFIQEMATQYPNTPYIQ